ncbi:MAG TPA: hypothetical protein VFP84_31745 [Kofleriaceae bacterium]|nr:hypothetical protein [Kofleriaceae bacterium]
MNDHVRRVASSRESFGPHTGEIEGVFAALHDLRWCDRAGTPLHDARVCVVTSWDDALAIFEHDAVYGSNGLLAAACDPIDRALSQSDERQAWWHRARAEARPHEQRSSLSGIVPLRERELLAEHLYEFVSMLLAEIVTAPEVGSTYFRDQLAWFRAGRFPCGWDGAWPAGRMRVY